MIDLSLLKFKYISYAFKILCNIIIVLHQILKYTNVLLIISYFYLCNLEIVPINYNS